MNQNVEQALTVTKNRMFKRVENGGPANIGQLKGIKTILSYSTKTPHQTDQTDELALLSKTTKSLIEQTCPKDKEGKPVRESAARYQECYICNEGVGFQENAEAT